MDFRVLLVESDEGVAVSCPMLRGCHPQGATREEAIENIRIAIREWLDVEQVEKTEFRRGHVVQTAVGMFFIVFISPSHHHLLSMMAVGENVHVQAFVAKLVVEALDVRIFPGVAWRDLDRSGAAFLEPGLERFGDQFRAIIRTKVRRSAVEQE